MIGKTISHYKISDKLGEGGMGVVYKAEDTKLERTVALKFLLPHTLGSDEERIRFVREAKAAAALDHPNICTVHEIDESGGRTFIAMAYLDGQSLEEKVRSGPLSSKEAVDMAVQVAEGLQEAHENGIVHRDIKSANIMIGKKGQAKIMDFGLAKLAGKTKLTKTATIMGTVAYMSPEQALGETVDHRTDIWSLGVVLYEALTGKLPFIAENDAALLHKIIYDELAKVTGLNPYVPPGLSVVIERAMAKNRDERYSRISEFLRDIRSFQTLHSSVRSRPAPAPPNIERLSADSPEVYKKAEKRVKAKMRFYKHVAFFTSFNLFLLMINLLTSASYLWFKWPLLAFSVPLAVHAIKLFVFHESSVVRERMIEEELRRESTKKS
jgi:serine/threonine protein kinase